MLDQDSNYEVEDPAILEIRRRYLTALGVGLGLDEEVAQQNAARLVNTRKMLLHIDPSKNKDEADPHDVSQIESVGSWFLEGNEPKMRLKYTVGAKAISLLREDPNSGYFTNLKDWVDMWTTGDGVEAFQRSLDSSPQTPKTT